MSPHVQAALLDCERLLNDHMAKHFVPEAQFAFLALVPGNPAADVLLVSCSLDEARAAFDRAAERANVRDIVGFDESTPLKAPDA